VAGARPRGDAAERRHNRLRVAVLAAGTTVPVAAVVGLNTLGSGGAMGLLGGTLALTAGCFAYERRYSKAIEAETEALRTLRGADPAGEGQTVATSGPPPSALRAPSTTAGDGSTLDSSTVDGVAPAAAASSLVDGTDTAPSPAPAALVEEEIRAELLRASEGYRLASLAWQDLAGNVPAPWVLSQRDRIRRCAELRAAVDVPSTARPGTGETSARSAALIAALTTRVADNRARVAGAESLPLFLDDPLAGVDGLDRAPVLELLGRLAGRQQVVVVTADEAVLSWARLEAKVGSLGVIASAPGEPNAETRSERNAEA
jgi:hypothetical protein